MIYALLIIAALSDPTIRPNPVLTPGAVRELTYNQVCNTKWSKDRRFVTTNMRKSVTAAYGLDWVNHSEYVIDHLIPRELGGADMEANLWPQKINGFENAKQKDRLENFLHKNVCSGTISLLMAQQVIQSDWIAAYRIYGLTK